MFRECVELIAFRRVSALGMDSTVSLLLLIGESSLSHLYFHIFVHHPNIIISNENISQRLTRVINTLHAVMNSKLIETYDLV